MQIQLDKKTAAKTIFGAAFILSLTANVAAAGAFAGGGATPVLGKVAAAITAFADLSPESRGKTIDIVKNDWPDIQKQIAAVREKHKAVKDLLATADYQRADAEKLMIEVRAETAALQEKGQNLALDIADQLTPAERAKLIQSVEIAP